jgi:hypothetical protein
LFKEFAFSFRILKLLVRLAGYGYMEKKPSKPRVETLRIIKKIKRGEDFVVEETKVFF